MKEFRFVNELGSREIGDTIGVLEKPRLWIPETDYPDYYFWLEKVEEELGKDLKRGLLAYAGKEPVGAVLYQRHKGLDGTVEIKNISVSPDMRGRYFGAFMLRNVEMEALNFEYPDCDRIMVDTKTTNNDMIGFLLRQGYEPKTRTDLYGLGTGEDIVFTKSSDEK